MLQPRTRLPDALRGVPVLQQAHAQHCLMAALMCLPPGSRLVGGLAVNHWLWRLGSKDLVPRPRLELATSEHVADLDVRPPVPDINSAVTNVHRCQPRLSDTFMVPDMHPHGLGSYAHLRHPITGINLYVVEARHADFTEPVEVVPGFKIPVEPLERLVVTLIREATGQTHKRPMLRWRARALLWLLDAIQQQPGVSAYEGALTGAWWASSTGGGPLYQEAVEAAKWHIRDSWSRLARPARHPGRWRQLLQPCPDCRRTSFAGGLTVSPTWELALDTGVRLTNPDAMSVPR